MSTIRHPFFTDTFPKVLGEQEELNTIVELPDDWREATDFGVTDLEKRRWAVSPAKLKLFVKIADQAASGLPMHFTSDDLEEGDAAGAKAG